MGTGIMICGLNGTGKSTLGKALAKKLNFAFIDSEELYFRSMDNGDIYGSSRTREEAVRLLCDRIKACPDFVFASVKGDYGEAVSSSFRYIVLTEVPKAIRMERVRNRSFQQFGNKMLKGGDLYEREEAFLEFIESRAENSVEEWVRSLSCPVMRVDGTKPIEENIRLIMEQLCH